MSTKLLLILYLMGLLLVLPTLSADCSNATSSACGKNQCLGYIMVQGICMSTCSRGSYYQNSSSSCVSCSTLGPTDCSSSCTNYYYTANSNSTNSTNATNSTNSTNSTSSCLPCTRMFGLSCTSCTPLACSSCSSGHTLATSRLRCVNSACNVSNCVICAGPASCYLCEAGYHGQTCSASNCNIPYCQLCEGSACVACSDGYLLSNGECILKCRSHCAICASPATCVVCKDGYTLNNLTSTCSLNCSIVSSNCISCQNSHYCSECASGYSLSEDGRTCQVAANCSDSKCSRCSGYSSCSMCKTGHTLASTSACKRDICFIKYCAICKSHNKCATCATNYNLSINGKICTPSCASVIPQCLTCSSSAACSSCKIGFSGSNCSAICSIANCSICYSSTTCLQCASGYLPSSDLTTCNIQCGDSRCSTCFNATYCSVCVTGSVLSNGKCRSSCKSGYALNINSVCQLCSLAITNCESCYMDSSNYTQCLACSFGYYTSSTACFQCSAVLTNCLTCTSPSACTRCAYGYALTSTGLCQSRSACTAKNCELCQTNSTTSCSSCSSGFSLSNGSCTYGCTNGQILIDGACSCPYGSYSAASSCVSCGDAKCITCTASSCSQCVNGYYASGSQCVSCIDNCQSCGDGSTCYYCKPPYAYFNGKCSILGSGFRGCVDSAGLVYTCDPGCDSCSVGSNNIVFCNIFIPGYTKVQGRMIRCDPSCKSCSGTPTNCISCHSGFVLLGTQCSTCSDQYATSCSATDVTFSLTCIGGYTATASSTAGTSTCQACADGCDKCNVNGAGACDTGQCKTGYVQQTGNTNCTRCMSFCSVCSSDDIATCISCGTGRFMNSTSGACDGCPSGCQSCTSSTICTTCFPGFIASGTLCIAGPSWPCVSGTSANCTQCVQGFVLSSSGICSYIASCNATSTCTSCAYGYYLSVTSTSSQGNCLVCPTISNCLSCDPSKITACLLCSSGYYSSSGSCAACSAGCSQCSSNYSCSKAASGYYLIVADDGSESGKTAACSSACLTCTTSPEFCLSCNSGYALNGSTCFSKKKVHHKMVFAFPGKFTRSDSYQTCSGSFLNNFGFFFNLICSNLPTRITKGDKKCRFVFNILNIFSGSTGMTTAIDGSTYSTSAEATSDLSSSPLVPGADVVSSSFVSDGYDSSSSSSTNLALILGVSIPLGILLMVIIGIIAYSKNKETREGVYDEKDKGASGQNINQNKGIQMIE